MSIPSVLKILGERLSNPDGDGYVVDAAAVAGLGNHYTVGPAGLGRFQTIQAAIDAAVLAGASWASPAVIDIIFGKYTENLVVTGGGIFLRGIGGTGVLAGTVITGTIDWQIPATLDCFYGTDKIRVSGAQTISGDTTAANVVFYTNFCEFRTRVTVATTVKAQFYDNGSTWRNLNAADVLLLAAGAMSFGQFVNSRFVTSAGVRAARLFGSLQITNAYASGKLELANTSNSFLYGGFYQGTSTCVEAAGSGGLFATLLMLAPTTATPSALVHSGTGFLSRAGIFTTPTAGAPQFVNTGVGADFVGVAV